MRMNRYLLASVLALAMATSSWAQDAAPRQQSRAELEAQSRELDQHVIELQHDIMAARHEGDPEALKRAETELKSAQEKRVDTLRGLGQLP